MNNKKFFHFSAADHIVNALIFAADSIEEAISKENITAILFAFSIQDIE